MNTLTAVPESTRVQSVAPLPGVRQSADHAGSANPDQALLERILGYKHEALVERLERKLNISHEKAQQVFEDTKRFLFICGTCPGKWSPSRDIDEGWHNFILFTQDYMDFCQKFFGRYIHHVPNIRGQGTDRERPKRTLVAAMQLFGKENLSENWIYRNEKGEPVLGPAMSLSSSAAAEAKDPCDSCGCNAAQCSGDS